MSGERQVAGLDVGSTKVACIVAEEGEDGRPRALGVGVRPCEGLRRGVVVHLEKTVRAIEGAVRDAEVMADLHVEDLVVGISGEHLTSLNSKGVTAVAEPQHEIQADDVLRVIEAARAIAVPLDREIVHAIPQGYTIDDQSGIREPTGMSGVRLEVDCHLITGSITPIQNLTRAVERAGYRAGEIVLQSVAVGKAVLDPDELELGVVLLDIGGGTTDLAIYYDGAIRASAVLPFGGQQVTNDVAMGLRTPVARAERIKIEHGCAVRGLLPEREGDVVVPGVGGRPDRKVSHEVLTSIVGPRVEELLRLAHREALRSDAIDLVSGGIVVTGGTACLPGVCELAEQVFDLPARLGVPRGVSWQNGNGAAPSGREEWEKELSDPRHAAGVGLVLHAFEGAAGAPARRRKNHGMGRALERVRSLVAEIL